MDKYNLFSNTNVLLFEVITILIYHFALFFNIFSQKKKKKKKKKSNRKTILAQPGCLFFFVFYVGETYILRRYQIFNLT